MQLKIAVDILQRDGIGRWASGLNQKSTVELVKISLDLRESILKEN